MQCIYIRLNSSVKTKVCERSCAFLQNPISFTESTYELVQSVSLATSVADRADPRSLALRWGGRPLPRCWATHHGPAESPTLCRAHWAAPRRVMLHLYNVASQKEMSLVVFRLVWQCHHTNLSQNSLRDKENRTVTFSSRMPVKRMVCDMKLHPARNGATRWPAQQIYRMFSKDISTKYHLPQHPIM